MGRGSAGAAAVLRCAALALIPVALVMAHRNLPVVMVLVALTGLAALWRDRRVPPRWVWPALALAGVLALSTVWSPSADDRGWALRLPALVVALVALMAAARRTGLFTLLVFGAGITASSLLVAFDAFSGGAIRGAFPPEVPPDRDAVAIARGLGLTIVLLPAGLLALAASISSAEKTSTVAAVIFGAAGTFAVGAAAFASDIAANGLAFGAAMTLAPLGWLWRERGGAITLLILAAGFAIWPLIALGLPDGAAIEAMTDGPVSWRHRLLIWRTVADAATADGTTFLFGAGQHASAVLTETAGQVSLPGSPIPFARVPSHPHNVFLQVWYEAGLLGTALAMATLVLAARALRLANITREVAAAMTATGGAALVFWSVDASVWTIWRLAAFGLAAFGVLVAHYRMRAAKVVHAKTRG